MKFKFYLIHVSILIIILLLISQLIAGQKLLLQGVVTDNKGEPLAYANVFLKNRFEGTVTGNDGKFVFQFHQDGKFILICSYIGYNTYEKEINAENNKEMTLLIKLKPTEIRGKSVMVTASAFTTADDEGVTLTSMDVVRTPGAAADLFWAIKTYPGLTQVEEGAGLFVRGGDVSETVSILDGAVINHPYKYESPTGGYFGTFNPFLLKGTFFSSGGFSAQYGNALSGALSMESLDLPEAREISLGLGLAAESAFIALPVIQDKLGILFSGNRSNTKMMFDLNNCKKDFSGYPYSTDLNLSINYKMSNVNQFKFFIFKEDDRVGVEVDDPDYTTHFHGNTSNILYNFKYKALINKRLLIQTNVAYSDFNRDMNLGVMKLDIRDKLYQSRLIGEIDFGNYLDFRFGGAFFNNKTIISGQVPEDELDLNPDAVIDYVDTDYNSYRLANFVELQFLLPFGVQVTPGVRTEYESVSNVIVADPRFALNCPLSTTSNLTASFGVFHQYPEPQYYDPYTGNPELGAMKAFHYILGYAYKEADKIFRVEGYFKDYDRLILENERSNYTNEGNGYATGMDFFVKNSYGPVSGRLSYGWLKARRKWEDLPVTASPYFDITHNLTVVLNINLPKQVSLGSSFRYATGKPYTSAPGRYNEDRTPDYQKWDVTLSYLHSFFHNNMTIFYVAVSNILGRINIFDYRYSKDFQRRDAVESSFRRSVYFGVSFNI